jgi:hypothetical protein
LRYEWSWRTHDVCVLSIAHWCIGCEIAVWDHADVSHECSFGMNDEIARDYHIGVHYVATLQAIVQRTFTFD